MDKCVMPEGSTPKCSKILALNALYRSLEDVFSSYKSFRKSQHGTQNKLKQKLAEVVIDSFLPKEYDPIGDVLNPYETIDTYVDKETLTALSTKINNRFKETYDFKFKKFLYNLEEINRTTKGFNGFCDTCDLRIACDLKNYEGV
jgi:hypothetical protein